MSSREKSPAPVVERRYVEERDACTRALEMLLKEPIRNEGSPTLAALDDTRGEPERVSRIKKKYTE